MDKLDFSGLTGSIIDEHEKVLKHVQGLKAQLTEYEQQLERLEAAKNALQGKPVKGSARSTSGKRREVSPEGQALRTIKIKLARAKKAGDRATISKLEAEKEKAQKAYDKVSA